jgi:hypothetical protein
VTSEELRRQQMRALAGDGEFEESEADELDAPTPGAPDRPMGNGRFFETDGSVLASDLEAELRPTSEEEAEHHARQQFKSDQKLDLGARLLGTAGKLAAVGLMGAGKISPLAASATMSGISAVEGLPGDVARQNRRFERGQAKDRMAREAQRARQDHMAARADLDKNRLALAQRRADQGDRSLALREEGQQAQQGFRNRMLTMAEGSDERKDEQHAVAMADTDPASEASQAMQSQLRDARDAIRAGSHLAALKESLTDEDIAGLSAAQIQKNAVLRELLRARPPTYRGRFQGEPGAGGGGGGQAAGGAQAGNGTREVQDRLAHAMRQNIYTSRLGQGWSEDEARQDAEYQSQMVYHMPPDDVFRMARSYGLSTGVDARQVSGADRREATAADRIGNRVALESVEVSTRLDAIEGSMRGLSDNEIRAAIAGMKDPRLLAGLWETNPRAAQFAQEVSGFSNIQLKDRSGAAVTNPEFDRWRMELGSGSLITAQALRHGLTMARRSLTARQQAAQARPRPARGPVAPPPTQQQPQAAQEQIRVRRASDGVVKMIPARFANSIPAGYEVVQ